MQQCSAQIGSDTLIYYRFDTFNVQHGIFTRHGGVSAAPFGSLNTGGTVGDRIDHVEENISRIYRALDVDGSRAVSVWQVHSADCVIASIPAPGRRWVARADALITDTPNVPLIMRFADCVPILLHDPVRRAIGIVHAGWRGTVSQVVTTTLQTMIAAYGCKPENLQAGIGPSIGVDSYQVGEEVVAAARESFGEDALASVIQRGDDGSAYFDLWEANRYLLNQHGVTQVEVMGVSTALHTDEWYSHRAEQGKTGRFSAVISL